MHRKKLTKKQEILIAKRAIKTMEKEKKEGKLKKLHSLADLMD